MKSTSLLHVWPRLMVELIVIVVGILMALGLDAWWGERQDRQAERVALGFIHEEFVENQQRFDEAFDHHIIIRDALVKIADSTPADCNEDLTALLETAIFEWHTFDPLAGATQSLISSGGLNLVRDKALRIRLASWSGLFSELEKEEMRAVQGRDKVSDYVAREFPDYDCPSLLGDSTFKFLLRLREGEEEEVIEDNTQIPESIQQILDATDPASL